jgi:hypothetical protein
MQLQLKDFVHERRGARASAQGGGPVHIHVVEQRCWSSRRGCRLGWVRRFCRLQERQVGPQHGSQETMRPRVVAVRQGEVVLELASYVRQQHSRWWHREGHSRRRWGHTVVRRRLG